jgi:hypothetical protein
MRAARLTLVIYAVFAGCSFTGGALVIVLHGIVDDDHRGIVQPGTSGIYELAHELLGAICD